jgi:hypothetical protein
MPSELLTGKSHILFLSKTSRGPSPHMELHYNAAASQLTAELHRLEELT